MFWLNNRRFICRWNICDIWLYPGHPGVMIVQSHLVNLDKPLRWRHNDHAGVSNHQPHGCLLNRSFRRKSKKTSKLRVTGLCAGNSPGTGEFPAQMASYAENVSIWWRHHDVGMCVPNTFKGRDQRLHRADITYPVPVSGTYALSEIIKSSNTFSATNISSNIIWLLQLHDTI